MSLVSPGDDPDRAGACYIFCQGSSWVWRRRFLGASLIGVIHSPIGR
jgi:hypothetical protein